MLCSSNSANPYLSQFHPTLGHIVHHIDPRQPGGQGDALATSGFDVGFCRLNIGERLLGRLWGCVLCLGAGLSQDFGFIKQAALGCHLLGAGTEHTLAGKNGLLEHADNVIVGFLADGFNQGGMCILLGLQQGLQSIDIVR